MHEYIKYICPYYGVSCPQTLSGVTSHSHRQQQLEAKAEQLVDPSRKTD